MVPPGTIGKIVTTFVTFVHSVTLTLVTGVIGTQIIGVVGMNGTTIGRNGWTRINGLVGPAGMIGITGAVTPLNDMSQVMWAVLS